MASCAAAEGTVACSERRRSNCTAAGPTSVALGSVCGAGLTTGMLYSSSVMAACVSCRYGSICGAAIAPGGRIARGRSASTHLPSVKRYQVLDSTPIIHQTPWSSRIISLRSSSWSVSRLICPWRYRLRRRPTCASTLSNCPTRRSRPAVTGGVGGSETPVGAAGSPWGKKLSSRRAGASSAGAASSSPARRAAMAAAMAAASPCAYSSRSSSVPRMPSPSSSAPASARSSIRRGSSAAGCSSARSSGAASSAGAASACGRG